MALQLPAALVLLIANGFFVATEFSLARLRPTQVDEWERTGRPGARSVRHAVEHIDAYLAACQLGITLASLGLGVVGEAAFHDLLEPVFGAGTEVAGIALAGALAFGLITLLHVVVGELAPKSLAIARTERTILWVAPFMRFFYLATRPVVDLFNGMGNLLLKPFGIPPAREVGSQPHTEDELRGLLRQSSREGLIDPEEQALGENVLTFGDRRAREVMRPRPEVVWLPVTVSPEEAGGKVIEAGLTRLPVCDPDGGLDAALGVVHAKDLLAATLDAGSSPRELRDILRPLARVADSTLIDEALSELRRQREHIALVVDEHGTAVGLITLEDILEEIVGEIEDEFDAPHEEAVSAEDDGWRVRGNAPLHEVEVAIGLEVGDSHEATFGGHLLERLGRVPAPGETIGLDGHVVEILGVGDARIEEVRITPAPAPTPTGERRAG